MIFTGISVNYRALEGMMQQAYADCILDEDWPDKPCLDEPPYSEEYLRQVWQQYYDYKDKEWMAMKKSEMDQAIANGTLSTWVETQSSSNNFANNNVWQYYYLNDEAPSIDIQGEIIQIWSEPRSGTLYSQILTYANFCSVIENHDLTDGSLLNITAILSRPDGQTEKLDQFAEVSKRDCDRALAYSFIPQLAGDYGVSLIIHVDDKNVSSNSATVTIVSGGLFQSGKVTIMLDSEELRALDHAPDPNYAYAFRVLDWSRDGKSILFGYHDYSNNSALRGDSLAIIDTQTFNVSRLYLSANNTNDVYNAKFSPSNKSIFALLGNNSQYPDKPENIFEYNLENRTRSQITNSSTVYWFDTLDSVNGSTLIYVDSTRSHLWPYEAKDLKESFDRAASRLYYYLPYDYGTPTSGTGTLDLNEDASRLVFTGELGGLIGNIEGLEPGIHVVEVQSGESTILTTRSPCVSSAKFAPNDDLILYTEHPGQSCGEPTPEMGPSLRIASLDGALDEIVYNDRRTLPIGVVSPDGRFVATVGYAYMVNDQYPKMLTVELPKSIPEFDIFLVPMLLASIIGVLIAANRFSK